MSQAKRLLTLLFLVALGGFVYYILTTAVLTPVADTAAARGGGTQAAGVGRASTGYAPVVALIAVGGWVAWKARQ